MKTWSLVVVLCGLLAACGGGSGGGSASGGGSMPDPPAPDPIVPVVADAPISFVGFYAPTPRTLTISPLAGATSLSTRGVAKVEVVANEKAPLTLVAPNASDASGRAIYRFDLPASELPVELRCGPRYNFRITVTDGQGKAFTKYASVCTNTEFGAFSDYGNRDIKFRLTATAPVVGSFRRAGNSYSDTYSSVVPATSVVWTVSGKEGDDLSLSAIFPAGTPSTARATLEIEGAGVVLLSNTFEARYPSGTPYVACCRGPEASTAGSRTVTLTVSPSQRAIVGDVNNPLPYDVSYSVINPTDGRVLQAFDGVRSGYSQWTFNVPIGADVRLQAALHGSEDLAHVSIESGNILASTVVTLQGVPSFLRVFCCSK